ncbi:MAG: LPS export ABC transporter permease LptF [Pseudomonadota bacterium]
MTSFQRYLFETVLRTLVSIVGGLALIALLTQGLSQIDLIVENQQSALTYLWVSVLAAPQIISLMLPIALFVATTSALNRAHRDSEIVVAQASGMSNWGVASPVLRLAMLATLLHLVINLWVQPTAYREMRETVVNARSDLAASLIREGAFTTPADGLTVYVRQTLGGGRLRDLLISDSRDPDAPGTYIAQTGVLTEVEGAPAIVMRNGHFQQLSETGSLSNLDFDQYVFDLSEFAAEEEGVLLKASDRYLPELFYPDATNYYAAINLQGLWAEGHARISAPLLNIAMAMLAIYAVIGGDFSRRGYQARIGLAAAAAIGIRLAALGATSAAEDNPDLNVLQYLTPIIAAMIIGILFFGRPLATRARLRASSLPAGAAAA